MLGRDHHPALLTIRRTALAAALNWPRTFAPINIPDGLLDEKARIGPVRLVHDGIVAGVEANCPIPKMLAYTPLLETGGGAYRESSARARQRGSPCPRCTCAGTLCGLLVR